MSNEVMRDEMKARLTQLTPGWLDGDGQLITAIALTQADAFLASCPENVAAAFSVFPMEQGGVQLQWVNNDSYISVEADEEGQLYAYSLKLEGKASEDLETSSVEEALAFVLQRHPLGTVAE